MAHDSTDISSDMQSLEDSWFQRLTRGRSLTMRGVIECGGVALLGLALIPLFFPAASIPGLLRFTFGDRTNPPPADELELALLADLGVIAGYVLLLGACAVIGCRFATTDVGARFGRVLLGCALAAAGADAVEDLLLLASVRLPLAANGSWAQAVSTATAAFATVKWCVLLTAAAAVPFALAVLMLHYLAARQHRSAAEGLDDLARATGAGRPNEPNGSDGAAPQKVRDWWDECRQGPRFPKIPAAEESRLDSWSWISAYDVPEADDVIDGANGAPVHAICLSGGGVRSACISMGALQVLSNTVVNPHEKDGSTAEDGSMFIDEFDYVVSVSGGGYTAGARLMACHATPTAAAQEGLEPMRTATALDVNRPVRLSERFNEGSVEFEHLRRNSSYIADSLPSLLRALGYVLRNMLASVVIVFWVPVMVGLLAGYLLARLPMAAIVPVPALTEGPRPKRLPEDVLTDKPDYFQALVDHPAGWFALGIFVVTAILLLVRAMRIEKRHYDSSSEGRRGRVLVQMHGVVIVGIVVAVMVLGLPALMRLCASSVVTDLKPQEASGAIAGVLGLQYAAAIASMVWRRRSQTSTGGMFGRLRRVLPPGLLPHLLVLITLTVIAIAWLAILGSVAAGVFGYLTKGLAGEYPRVDGLFGVLAVTGSVVLLLCLADVTSLSLHPFYRWRLARTFSVRRVIRMVWNGALPSEPHAESYPETEPTWLHTHGAIREGGPRFVFAGAAAVSGAGKPAPGLNAVSFVMSAGYIGGPELGWLKTDKLWAASTPRIKRDLTVQAAVAISGAAFASAMGRQNKGFQTLLAMSGARLGTWLPNPRYVAALSQRYPGTGTADQAEPTPTVDSERSLLRGLPRVRGFTYFYRELLGRHSNDGRLVQVTDGGHYENLGLVEALRRRARVIVCIDGGGDPPPLLSGLADAMRLARSELGVVIELDQTGAYAAPNLAPGRGDRFPVGDALSMLNSRVTAGTVVRGRIIYPEASGLPEGQREGVLIVAKAVLWRHCPDWLLTYAGNSSVFPHDSTSDQWFSEGQFAAYTELGRILGRAVVTAYNAETTLDLSPLECPGSPQPVAK